VTANAGETLVAIITTIRATTLNNITIRLIDASLVEGGASD